MPAPCPNATAAGTACRTGPLIAVLIAANFVMVLNETIFSVALREMSVDLGVPMTVAQWSTTGFLLAVAVVIPTTGHLLDRFGPRRVFLAALGLFSAGTLLGGVAPGLLLLLVARVVQAAGTAMMIPLTMTSITRLVAPRCRGAVTGTFTVVVAVAPAVGPTGGGAVLAWLGWRGLFWLVLPLALAALAVGARLLRLPGGHEVAPADLASILLSAVGFGGVVYGLSALGEQGGRVVAPWVPIAAGSAALALFVGRQRRLEPHGRALLDLRPLRSRGFVTALVVIVPVQLCLIGVASVLLPLFVQVVLGLGTLTTGLALLPGGALVGLLGRPIGALFDRLGARPLVVPGAVLTTVALGLLATLGPASVMAAVIALHMLLMGGLALMTTPLVIESLDALADELRAHGSAILATAQQVAGALGVALFVTAATSGSAGAHLDAGGLRTAFVVGVGVGVAALVASLSLGRGTSTP